ncbi:MAG TPA: FAD-dependent oxidoreductase [Longimicrobiales bacterium]|nr:FAD-dependent oxidoreductase [Longimicrobiales bacterium]
MTGGVPAGGGSDSSDLIVVGGGIQGACVALEAARRGLRPILVERGEFGAATSANSLRILHGGFRYLQTADLARMTVSIRERRWFCRSFPDLVRPLPCLLPLYGRGVRRPAVLRAALALNDLLSADRNRGVPEPVHLPPGAVLGPQRVADVFPGVRRDGLKGGALWYDALMTDPDRIVAGILAWTRSLGGTTLDHVEAVGLRTDDGSVAGIHALDHRTGATRAFAAPIVVNCAGPWAADVAAALGSPAPGLVTRALAFNLLLDREPVAEAAVAVEPAAGGRMLFVVPIGSRMLAGTFHAPWTGSSPVPVPTEAQVLEMLADLNGAMPGLDLTRRDVAGIQAGFMPAARPGEGTPATRPVVLDHGRRGGMRGLFSVVGVKYTTARDVAERVLTRIYGRMPVRDGTGRPGAAAVAPTARDSLTDAPPSHP